MISYETITGKKTWTEIISEGNQFSSNHDVISICHTRRQVGNRPLLFVWFNETQTKPQEVATQKLFESGKGDWDKLMLDGVAWLDEFIAPHDLVSISLFEDNHSDEGKCILVVTHTAGTSPKPLSTKQKDGLYMYALQTDTNLEHAMDRSFETVKLRGHDSGLVVTHAVDTQTDKQVVATIFWDKIREQTMADQKRPTECSCNIF